MKIAFVGNMNNMPLMYAREMRELGHEVHFYVDAPKEEPLHRPECRYPEFATYPDWMFEVGAKVPLVVAYGFPRIFRRRLVKALARGHYDGVVLDGFAVGLAAHLRARCFALLAGFDLDVLCDPQLLSWKRFVRSSGFLGGTIRYVAHRADLRQQRAGLRACGGFNYFAQGLHARGEELLAEIYNFKRPFRLQIRGTDHKQLAYVEPSSRRGNDTIVLVAARFLWREPLPATFSAQENKRNDRIIRGIAEFLATSDFRPQFVLVEKGPHVAETKALASELGIAGDLQWVPEMTQAEIFEWYRRADIVIDQLGDHMLGAVGWDSMLTGRPVIANGRPDVFGPLIGEPSPLCQASTPSELADWLRRLVDDPALRREIGIRSREYIVKYFNMTETARRIAQYFEAPRSS